MIATGAVISQAEHIGTRIQEFESSQPSKLVLHEIRSTRSRLVRPSTRMTVFEDTNSRGEVWIKCSTDEGFEAPWRVGFVGDMERGTSAVPSLTLAKQKGRKRQQPSVGS